MPVGKIDAVTLYVSDWPAMFRWYTEVLGLSVQALEEHDQFCMLAADGETVLALASDHPELAASTGENRCAPSFYTEDLDATLADLEAKGVSVEGRIEGEDEGYRLTRIWDPEGNRLNLYTYG